MGKLSLGILFGGKSSEYEVSLSSAYALLSNVDREKYDVLTIGITKDGKWYLFEGDIEKIRDGSWYCSDVSEVFFAPTYGKKVMGVLRDGGKIEKLKLDVVFPVLHGRFGEDGRVQGLLSVAGIPAVGCGCTAAAVCMDKALTKTVVGAANIVRQAKAVVALSGDDTKALRRRAEHEIGYPMFVKPASSGSSVGCSKVKDGSAFDKAVNSAFAEDEKILIEECITGREIEVAVLEEGGRLTVSVPAEIDVGSSEFYDYETKYVSDESSFYIPARIDEEAQKNASATAAKIFTALGCRGLSRVDFFYTAEGELIFNEINTLPGFTPISMYPKLMGHAGIGYSELIDRLIASALK